MSEHGSFYWNELITDDIERCRKFYAEVIGWSAQAIPMPGPDGDVYTVFQADDGVAGGMLKMTATTGVDGSGPRWLSYVAVDDVDGAVARVTDSGGTVVQAPFDVEGVGRIAVIVDPTGAALGLITPETIEHV